MAKVNVQMDIPASCAACPFKHSVYGNDDLMFGDPEYDYFIGYSCRCNPKGDTQTNAELLRYKNDNCPFKDYLPVVRKPASEKQKALVEVMEQYRELPRCKDKETAQGCFLYIRDNIDRYKELYAEEREKEKRWADELEEDYEFYAFGDEPW